MIEKIKVSVIIPIYNVEKFLPKCLVSLEAQTLEEIEIILVNDGSTDNCAEIVKKFQNKTEKQIQYIEKENGGSSAARNDGLKVAKGEYIAFIDGDDYIDKDYLEVLYQSAKEENADVVICGYKQVDEDGKVLKIKKQIEGREDLPSPGVFVVWAHLFRKSLIQKNNLSFPVGKIFEDVMFSTVSKYKADVVHVLPYTGYNYVQRRGSIMHSGVLKTDRFPFQEFESTIDKLCKDIEEEKRLYLYYEMLFFFAGFLFVYCRRAKYIDIKRLCTFVQNFLNKITVSEKTKIYKKWGSLSFIEKKAIEVLDTIYKYKCFDKVVYLMTRF